MAGWSDRWREIVHESLREPDGLAIGAEARLAHPRDESKRRSPSQILAALMPIRMEQGIQAAPRQGRDAG